METPEQIQGAYLNTLQAAKYLGLAAASLEKFRCLGGGPVFIRRPGGRRILYSQIDLDNWMSGGRMASTSVPAPAAVAQ